MYSISAYDKKGFFSEIKKRYHDFFILHELFLNRYRGLYLPQLPPKKTFNNKDRTFIEEGVDSFRKGAKATSKSS